MVDGARVHVADNPHLSLAWEANCARFGNINGAQQERCCVSIIQVVHDRKLQNHDVVE